MSKILPIPNYTFTVKKPCIRGLIPYSISFVEEVVDPIFLEFQTIPDGVEVYLPNDLQYSVPFQIKDGYSLGFKFNFTDTVQIGTYIVKLVNITNDEIVTEYTFIVEE